MDLVHAPAPRSSRQGDTRQLDVLLRYGDDDVDAVADAQGVDISPAERDAILLAIDDELVRLVREGFDLALARCVREEIAEVQAGHRVADDD
jgi:hypothetical protein